MVSLKENTVMLSRPKRLGEMLGLWAGSVVAPMSAIGSWLRRSRFFHPQGIYFKAEVQVAMMNPTPPFDTIAQGLSQGDALVRLSAGIWDMKRGLFPDVLGFAIRFNTDAAADFEPQHDSQDLLLATSRRLITLPLAPLMTNQRDFLANNYYGMARFELAEQPNMILRIKPLTQSASSNKNRYDKIRDAVTSGDVDFLLEAASKSDPNNWFALVRIRLQTEVDLDDRMVKFWPFLIGQDIRPQGFTQFMRPIPYLSSQWARDARGR
jgi:hypothetical protein